MDSKSCRTCSYAKRENGKPTWCYFHEEAISENNTCDSYLDRLDSPAMSSLFNDLVQESQGKKAKNHLPIGNYVKDSFAWLFMILLFAGGVLAFLFC